MSACLRYVCFDGLNFLNGQIYSRVVIICLAERIYCFCAAVHVSLTESAVYTEVYIMHVSLAKTYGFSYTILHSHTRRWGAALPAVDSSSIHSQ